LQVTELSCKGCMVAWLHVELQSAVEVARVQGLVWLQLHGCMVRLQRWMHGLVELQSCKSAVEVARVRR
jgi:hypothetical protein